MTTPLITAALVTILSAGLHAANIEVTGETQLLQKPAKHSKAALAKKCEKYKNYKAFTGEVLGSGVRLRLGADVEAPILQELDKKDLLVVRGEKDSFYAVEAPSNMKVYIFRSFVLDGSVEGNRVNVRLKPDLTSPVVGHLSTGDKILDGKICETNRKWLEFTPPNNVLFFVAREYIQKIGGAEMKALRDEKLANLKSLVDTAQLLAQSELNKSFKEIDFAKVNAAFGEILTDYSEFERETAKVQSSLAKIKETYLNKKLAYLENKARVLGKTVALGGDAVPEIIHGQTALTSAERMKLWTSVEEALFATWSKSHFNKTMADFYKDQKQDCIKISGIVESYHEPVCNKPGNFLIRTKDATLGYVYSTMVDLHKFEGRYVTLIVSERPNNNFAYNAYFALGIEEE